MSFVELLLVLLALGVGYWIGLGQPSIAASGGITPPGAMLAGV